MSERFPEIIQFSASPPPLTSNQLHLMVASLDTLASNRERTSAVIDVEEQARAERFVNATHGDNFRLVRGTLRLCLAAYLGLAAEDIRFDFNKYGKPEIVPEQNHKALRFNISHSHQMAAFAFTEEKPIGVDIEFIKPMKDMAGLAEHVCCPQELDEFNAIAPQERQKAFFRLWTRKEAFIKAKGQGLSMGLRSIYIGFDTNRAIHRVQYRGDWLNNWLVKDLECDANYQLATTIEV